MGWWQAVVAMWAGIGGAGGPAKAPSGEAPAPAEARSVHPFTVKDLEGREMPLTQWKGKVLLIVNVASRCGYTPQYEGLERLYKRFKDRGLVVIGFPANEFGKQEPGTNGEIRKFCDEEYGVTFPMAAKLVVKGPGQAPLYRFLTDQVAHPKTGGEIRWNFTKFLVDGEGVVRDRFESRVKPESDEVVKRIEALLPAPKAPKP